MKLYVVTSPELGWDCVCAVIPADEIDYSFLEKAYPQGQYVIHERDMDTIEDIANLVEENLG